MIFRVGPVKKDTLYQPKFEKEIAVLDALSKRVIIGLLRHASPDLQDLLTKEVSQLASIF